jgi:hypothetical protein
MKTLAIAILTFVCLQVQAQNWIGDNNFLSLYKESDIVVIGTISVLTEFPKDKASLSDGLMPMKSLAVHNATVLKGDFDKQLIYFEDVFNGCMYAPTLQENYLRQETLIFAKVRNDTIYQIGSMNESPRDIGSSILNYNKIGSSLTSIKITNWFFESAKNNDVFYLLSALINLEKSPLFDIVDSINFSIEQRNELYNKLLSWDENTYNCRGIVSILAKYKDETYKKILKGYLVKLKNRLLFPEVDVFMLNIYKVTGNEKLQKIIKKFQKTWSENIRRKLILDFIAKI